MAVSPVLTRSPSVTTPSSSAAIKPVRVSFQASRNAQESLQVPETSQKDANRELTEQLNDDVRHKYIKGMIAVFIC